MKEFEFTTPLSTTKDWCGEIMIQGKWWMKDAEMHFEIDEVRSNEVEYSPEWRYIPHTFWTWLNSDKIEEIAYQHCLGLKEQERLFIDHTIQLKEGGLS